MATATIPRASVFDLAHETDAGSGFVVAPSNGQAWASTSASLRYNAAVQFIVPLNSGDTVTAATLTLAASSFSFDDMHVDLHIEDIDNSVDLLTNADVTSRTRSTASTAWTALSTGLGSITSPDFSTAVQEVIDRPGWTGSRMTVIFKAKSDTTRRFWIRNSVVIPTLNLTYTPASTVIGGGIMQGAGHMRNMGHARGGGSGLTD